MSLSSLHLPLSSTSQLNFLEEFLYFHSISSHPINSSTHSIELLSDYSTTLAVANVSSYRLVVKQSEYFQVFIFLYLSNVLNVVVMPSSLEQLLPLTFFFPSHFSLFIFYQLEANYFIILQWFLSYIEKNQPWIYMYSPTRSPLPPPSPPDPSGSSQCTRSKHLSHASNLGL